MVTALNKRILRIMKENMGRYTGIVVLIMLGSFYFFMAAGLSGNLENMVAGFAGEHRQEDLAFTLNRDALDIAALESESGALVEAYRQYDAELPGGELRLLTLTSKINIPAVLSGRGLENPGDILIDPSFSQTRGLKIGDTIEQDGKIFTITGTMAIPNYIYITKNMYDILPSAGFGIAVISNADMNSFSNASTVYSVYFENREDINAQKAMFHNLLTEKGHSITEWMDANNNIRIRLPWGNIYSMKSMSLPVAVFIFLIGCFITGVIIQRMVKQDGAVIGTLYAQGYRRHELTRHYIAIPILLTAIGSLAGTFLAALCIKPVFESLFMGDYILPAKNITFSLINTALAVLLPVLITGLSSFFIVHSILKKNTVELMKGGIQKAKVSLIERAIHLDKFSFSAKFQIREQMRSIPRLLFLVLGISVAAMILMYGLIFNHSMNVARERGMDWYVYAIEYNFKETQNIQDIALPQGSEPYNAIRAFPKDRESVEFILLGMLPDSVGLKISGTGGSYLSKNQVNITSSLAARLKLTEGDTITFVDILSRQMYSLTIDGIAESYGDQFVFMPIDDFNRMTDQPSGSFRTVYSNHEIDFDANLLSGIMDARNPQAFDDMNAQTTLITVSVTVTAILFTVIVIFLVTSLIIDESGSVVSLLKIFGYRKKELANMILNSSAPAVFVGFALGLLFMIFFGNVLFVYVADITNMLIPMVINPLYILAGFVLIFTVYEITKRLCGRKLSKIPMSEALKTE